MTPKQAAFVSEYLKDRNATQAAIRAGYSAKTASSQGERLLRNAEIRAAIDAALIKVADRAEVSAERVIRERARLAFFDPRKLFKEDGSPIPINELDDDTAAAIVGLDVFEEYAGTGKDRMFVGYTKKYKLAGKEPSLSALEKRLGLDQKTIRFPLPDITDLAGCIRAQETIIAAVADGGILASEGEALSRLIENKRRAIETTELEARIAALELKENPR